MSIKAGRVGVNPSQVDPVDGTIKQSAQTGYTKQEADAKFETKTNAASTYETKEHAADTYELKSDIGGLKFRNNDGTAQYQLPGGDWVNFSSGGSIPIIDLSELSPSTTGRSTIIVTARPDLIDEIVLYSDANRTVEVGRISFAGVCFVVNTPDLIDVYWRVYKNGEAVATSSSNSGQLKAYIDVTNHKFVSNANTVDYGHFGVVLIG